MANEIETEQGDAARPLVRCNFFEGKLMTHVAFQLEQEYHNRKHALSSRGVAGSGALCGLITGDFNFEDGELTFSVTPGAFIDGRGRLGVVPKDGSVTLKPSDEQYKVPAEMLPGGGAEEPGVEYYGLVVEVAEEEEAYEPKFVRDRPCWEDREAGRIREAHRFRLLPLVEASGETTSGPTPADHYVEACEEPTQAGVLLAVLDLGTGGPTVVGGENGVPRQLVYTNPMLYRLIQELGGGAPAGVRTINEVAPDAEGEIKLVSESIDIAKGAGENELSLDLRDEYVTGIGEAKPTAAGAIKLATDGNLDVKYPAGQGIKLSLADAATYVRRIEVNGQAVEAKANQVLFKGQKGIVIEAGTPNEVLFSLAEAPSKPDYNVVNGAKLIKMTTERGQDYSSGKLELSAKDIELKTGEVVAYSVGYLLPTGPTPIRSRKPGPHRVYFGEADLLPGRLRKHVELAGYVEVDKEGVMKKLQVYLRSRTKEKEVWVYYWMIEKINRTS